MTDPVRGKGFGPRSYYPDLLKRETPTSGDTTAKLLAMRKTIGMIRDLVLKPVPPSFSWASNVFERQHDPGQATRLQAFFASSQAAEAASVGEESDYSARFDLKINVIGPEQSLKESVPVLYRQRSFQDSGLENYPVKPLWKRRSDRSEQPVPLGQLLEKDGLISQIPPVIEAVTFVPIAREGAPAEERFDTQFEFAIKTRHATEFWVIREDEELLRRQLLMLPTGGERQIQDIVEEDGEEVSRFFKATFVPNLTTGQADQTPSVRGHFIIIAIPIVGEEPPSLLPLWRESALLSFGGSEVRSMGMQVGEVSIGRGDRSGAKSTLVDGTTRDTSLLPRIMHIRVRGARMEDEIKLGQDVAGALEFPVPKN